jgi:hypothetical protein
MNQEETGTIKLTFDEFENFRAIAYKFNVNFEMKQINESYYVTAPMEYIIRWGYDD